MSEAYLIDAVRTPMGGYRGALSGVRPDDMAAHTIAAVVERTGVDPERITDVYFGAANQSGEDNRDVARMAALLAGLPHSVPGATVNRLCASGLEAINCAARAVKLGEGDFYLGGGVESMSRAPWVVGKPERGLPRGPQTMHDTTLGWRFVNPRMAELGISTESMGETGENVAERYGISREDQDAFGLRSHQRAVAAAGGRDLRRGDRPDRGAEGAPRDGHGRRRRGPARRRLAGEDGEAAPRLPRGRHGHRRQRLDPQRRRRLHPDRLRGRGEGARRRAAGPRRRLRRRRRRPRLHGHRPRPRHPPRPRRRRPHASTQIDLIELNEAFASQVLASARELGIDEEKLNVNGGAIALGHPLGCSGARLATTLVRELRRRGGKYGIATMCVGVGQGLATVFEAV